MKTLENFPVYEATQRFRKLVKELVEFVPPRRGELRKQLRTAVGSIKNNLSEGYGERSLPEKARFYRYARRSASECYGCLDDLRIEMDGSMDERIDEGQRMAESIYVQLTKMLQALEKKMSS